MFFDILRKPFLPRNRKEICCVRGRDGEEVRIEILSENVQERSRADTYATKEPETLEWIRRYTKPGDIFWDIGANIGLYSLFAAKLGCRVWAFEPHIPNVNKLLKNSHQNKAHKNIKVVPIAISGGERFGGMLVSSREPGSSIHKFADEQFGGVSNIYFPKHSVLVEYEHHSFSSTVDRLVREWEFPEPNHIKIDVDGREDDILEGMKGILRASFNEMSDIDTIPYSGCLKTVLLEVHDDDLERMRSFMGLYGFVEDDSFPETSSAREKRRAVEEGGRWFGAGNCVFVRKT